MSPYSQRLRAESDMWGSRKLKEIGQAMDSVTIQEDLTHFFNDPENAQRLNGLVEDIHYALMDYQVCTPKRLTPIIPYICLRLQENKTSVTGAVS